MSRTRTMVKLKVGGVKVARNHRNHTRMSCRNKRTPIHERLPGVMSLDESETLLGSPYVSPSVTIIELDANCAADDGGNVDGVGTASTSSPRATTLNAPIPLRVKKRPPSISSAIPSPFTEQTTITSTGKQRSFVVLNYKTS